MPLRRKTIRKLSPYARDLARLQADVYSIHRRLKGLIVRALELELKAKALDHIDFGKPPY